MEGRELLTASRRVNVREQYCAFTEGGEATKRDALKREKEARLVEKNAQPFEVNLL